MESSWKISASHCNIKWKYSVINWKRSIFKLQRSLYNYQIHSVVIYSATYIIRHKITVTTVCEFMIVDRKLKCNKLETRNTKYEQVRVIVDGKLRQLLECIITGQQTSNKEYWVTARWWQVEVQQTWNKEYWGATG